MKLVPRNNFHIIFFLFILTDEEYRAPCRGGPQHPSNTSKRRGMMAMTTRCMPNRCEGAYFLLKTENGDEVGCWCNQFCECPKNNRDFDEELTCREDSV